MRVARSQYIVHNTRLSVTLSSLVVSLTHPRLATSPDGFAYDPSSSDPYGIVEFKNPYSVHDMKLIDACSTKDFCLSADSESHLLLRRIAQLL